MSISGAASNEPSAAAPFLRAAEASLELCALSAALSLNLFNQLVREPRRVHLPFVIFLYSLLNKNYLIWGTLSLLTKELELDSAGFIRLHVLRILLKLFNNLGRKVSKIVLASTQSAIKFPLPHQIAPAQA